jgi:hypothetical protein
VKAWSKVQIDPFGLKHCFLDRRATSVLTIKHQMKRVMRLQTRGAATWTGRGHATPIKFDSILTPVIIVAGFAPIANELYH